MIAIAYGITDVEIIEGVLNRGPDHCDRAGFLGGLLWTYNVTDAQGAILALDGVHITEGEVTR